MSVQQVTQFVALSIGLFGFVCFFGLIIFWVARANDYTRDFRQKLTVMIASVPITVMVVGIGALPTAQTAVAQVAGKIGVNLGTVNLGGTIAIWFIVFTITARYFRSDSKAHPSEPILMPNSDVEHDYRTRGFEYYRDWKLSLGTFNRVIEKSELHFIEDLLPKVFYHGSFDLVKPEKVTIKTLFCFSQGRAVKFQRIQGVKRTDTKKIPEVYLPQTSSAQGNQPFGLHFIRDENEIYETARHSHGDWKPAPLPNIDILLISVYEGDDVESGDYVYVDVTKYIDLERMDYATVEVAIVSDKQIREFNVWEVSASPASMERPIPLVFRKADSQEDRRMAAAIESNKKHIAKMFAGWDAILDQAFSGHLGRADGISSEEVKSFLLKVKSIIVKDGSDTDAPLFQELFHRLPGKDCVFRNLKHQRNVILSTFAWVK